ncbi:MAG: glycosyl transferase [Flavobacteriaceae bacterium]|nr:glycosyl transferase [Flavobacteriaceae bacterium]
MISIITINFNNAKGLEATLQSVQQQSFSHYEHIVIDGNSTDGSKEVIENYKANFSYWVSEPDHGVYHAMNKGIAVAKGEYLQFLNSGDVLENTNVLADVANEMSDKKDIYYGDLLFVGEGTSKLQTYPDELGFAYFKNRSLGHPAAFIKKELFNRVFYYNESLKIASDWEFFICAICKYNTSYRHINRVIAKFDTGGISSKESYQQLIKKEQEEVLVSHFEFYLKEHKQYEEKVRKFQNPPYSKVTQLLKNRVSKFLLLGFIQFLTFIFPNKK